MVLVKAFGCHNLLYSLKKIMQNDGSLGTKWENCRQNNDFCPVAYNIL